MTASCVVSSAWATVEAKCCSCSEVTVTQTEKSCNVRRREGKGGALLARCTVYNTLSTLLRERAREARAHTDRSERLVHTVSLRRTMHTQSHQIRYRGNPGIFLWIVRLRVPTRLSAVFFSPGKGGVRASPVCLGWSYLSRSRESQYTELSIRH